MFCNSCVPACVSACMRTALARESNLSTQGRSRVETRKRGRGQAQCADTPAHSTPTTQSREEPLATAQ
eukprot:2408413-Amphidinium_carterae.1